MQATQKLKNKKANLMAELQALTNKTKGLETVIELTDYAELKMVALENLQAITGWCKKAKEIGMDLQFAHSSLLSLLDTRFRLSVAKLYYVHCLSFCDDAKNLIDALLIDHILKNRKLIEAEATKRAESRKNGLRFNREVTLPQLTIFDISFNPKLNLVMCSCPNTEQMQAQMAAAFFFKVFDFQLDDYRQAILYQDNYIQSLDKVLQQERIDQKIYNLMYSMVPSWVQNDLGDFPSGRKFVRDFNLDSIKIGDADTRTINERYFDDLLFRLRQTERYKDLPCLASIKTKSRRMTLLLPVFIPDSVYADLLHIAEENLTAGILSSCSNTQMEHYLLNNLAFYRGPHGDERFKYLEKRLEVSKQRALTINKLLKLADFGL